MTHKTSASSAAASTGASESLGQEAEAAAPLSVPARDLPVPTADVSPGMQNIIRQPPLPFWQTLLKTGEEARQFADGHAFKDPDQRRRFADHLILAGLPE